VSKSIFSAPQFNDEAAAYAYVESKLWADGRVCPHCGVIEKSGALKGKTDRIGLYKCYACRKKFTVKIGTVFEDSHIQMRDWLTAIHLLCSSKKGISANQLHRTLGITLKSAWFMAHRLRLAMQAVGIEPLGGLETHVESDETFIGRLDSQKKARAGSGHKNTVLTLVERSGRAKSFHVASTGRAAIEGIVRDNVSKDATLMTDEAPHYKAVGKAFIDHQTVNHSEDEYVRGIVHTNTVEGFYSIFKRGMRGIYQHCSERHLHRYLAEFDFRYSNRVRLGVNDIARTERMIKGVVGKRLTYQTAN
jgi:transposase-like protein